MHIPGRQIFPQMHFLVKHGRNRNLRSCSPHCCNLQEAVQGHTLDALRNEEFNEPLDRYDHTRSYVPRVHNSLVGHFGVEKTVDVVLPNSDNSCALVPCQKPKMGAWSQAHVAINCERDIILISLHSSSNIHVQMGGAPSQIHNLNRTQEEIVRLMMPAFYTTDPVTEADIQAAKDSIQCVIDDTAPGYLEMKKTPEGAHYTSCLLFVYETYYNKLFEVLPVSFFL